LFHFKTITVEKFRRAMGERFSVLTNKGSGERTAGKRWLIEADVSPDGARCVLCSGPFPLENRIWNGGITMKSLTQKVQRFLVSEDGPTAVEYAVMLALIVIVCLTAISAIGTGARTQFNRVGSSIAEAS
jgi:pilus assembly protein Flp/PilA